MGLRLVQGGGEGRAPEALNSRDAVARVLLAVGAGLLRREVSAERASHVEGQVDEVLALFDRLETDPSAGPALALALEELELEVRELERLRRAGTSERRARR